LKCIPDLKGIATYYPDGKVEEYEKEKLEQKPLMENTLSDKKTDSQLQKYQDIYQKDGLDAAVKQMKEDGKNTGWITVNRDKIFPDKTLTEVNKSISQIEREGNER